MQRASPATSSVRAAISIMLRFPPEACPKLRGPVGDVAMADQGPVNGLRANVLAALPISGARESPACIELGLGGRLETNAGGLVVAFLEADADRPVQILGFCTARPGAGYLGGPGHDDVRVILCRLD